MRLPSGKVLLDHVSFPIGERCLVGVIGPSGAGKSTLLGALTGMRPATDGAVLYDNRDLYQHYAELRHRIGLVPQDNILHTQLSAQRALGYAAELRFPGDPRRRSGDRRVTEVIERARAEEARADPGRRAVRRPAEAGQRGPGTADQAVSAVPGRAHLRPGPRAGQVGDGDDDRLAKDGRTVIVVTHSVANLDICDRLLVLVPGGKVAFYGPPADGLKHFQKPGWAEVFQAFEAEPDRDWAADFRSSALPRRVRRGRAVRPAARAGPGPSAAPPPPPRTRGTLGQLSTLCRRYMAVIASDRNFLIMLAVLPIVLGALILAMGRTAPQGLAGHDNTGVQSVLLTLTICACLAGATNSVRELVKERPIYERERAAGLSSGAYLWSKLIVLGVITAVQAVGAGTDRPGRARCRPRARC